jgi:hypothetical protein
MHTKINKHQNDPNFLMHALWPKTSLNNQQVHLETLLILIHKFTKENMHKLRINIFVKPKIVINSPEVCFDIERQHAQVGHKNIIIFGYKNHLGSLCRNGKQFI